MARPGATDPHDRVREQLEKILEYRRFARAPRLSKFLRYLVEKELADEGSFLKESTIAVDHFGQPPDVDLKRFCAVRVTAGKARRCLAAYYHRHNDPDVQIWLPKGTYRPDFGFREHRATLLAPSDSRLATAVGPVETFPRAAKLEPVADEFSVRFLILLRNNNEGVRFQPVKATDREAEQLDDYDYLLELQLIRPDLDNLQLTAVLSEPFGRIIGIESVSRPDQEWQFLPADLAQSITAMLSGTRIASTPSEVERRSMTREFIDGLEGHSSLEQRTHTGIARAAEVFDSMLRRNEKDCTALAGSAEILLICHHYKGVPAKECWSEAVNKAKLAVNVDKRSAEANTVLAYSTLLSTHDFKEAERLFQIALELDPGYPRAHHWFCNLLTMTGRSARAIEHAEAALLLKPTSPIIWRTQGDPYYYSGRFDEAVHWYSCAIERHDNWSSHLFRGLSLTERGSDLDIKLAMRDFESASKMNPAARHLVDGAYGYLCAAIGDDIGAQTALAQLLTDCRPGAALSIAALYAGLKAVDLAYEWIEKALDDPTEHLFWFAVDPRFNNLRADSRHPAILERLGFFADVTANPR